MQKETQKKRLVLHSGSLLDVGMSKGSNFCLIRVQTRTCLMTNRGNTTIDFWGELKGER